MSNDAQNLITNEIYKSSSDLEIGMFFLEGNLQHPEKEGKLMSKIFAPEKREFSETHLVIPTALLIDSSVPFNLNCKAIVIQRDPIHQFC
jgi:hypothetical protein